AAATATTTAPMIVSTVLLPIALLRLPRLIVAGGARTRAALQEAAIGTIGIRRAGEIGLMLLLPRLRLERRGGRRILEGVMQPAMPVGRDAARFDRAGIDHPAAAALLRLVVAIAVLVGADIGAGEPRRPESPQGGVVPPRKEHADEGHNRGPASPR